MLKGLFKGPMPDITPPQIVAILVGGVPILAEFGRAFGLYSISLAQQAALSNAVTWAGVLAAALIGGDALLRTGRNLRSGKVEAVLAEGGEADKLEIVKHVSPPVAPVIQHPSAGTTTTGFEEPPPPR
jgi:hypothetical protein